MWEPGIGAAAFAGDERVWREIVAVRTAVRALLARAVSPAPPSRADAGRLPTAGDALDQLNKTAARVPATVTLDWSEDDVPRVVMTGAHRDPVVLLTAALARDAMSFLTHPDSLRLAACTAPRCVRYFLKEHGRQEYCKPSCSNRARVARHYQRQRAHADEGGEG
jgi:predicted RNA-binding Zn ribbon-like protein